VRVEKLITVYGLDHHLGAGGFSIPLRNAKDAAELQLEDARHRETALRYAMNRLQQELDLLAEYEAANTSIVRHTPSILPVPADSSPSTDIATRSASAADRKSSKGRPSPPSAPPVGARTRIFITKCAAIWSSQATTFLSIRGSTFSITSGTMKHRC